MGGRFGDQEYDLGSTEAGLGQGMKTGTMLPRCAGCLWSRTPIRLRPHSANSTPATCADPRATFRYVHGVDIAKKNPALFMPVKVDEGNQDA